MSTCGLTALALGARRSVLEIFPFLYRLIVRYSRLLFESWVDTRWNFFGVTATQKAFIASSRCDACAPVSAVQSNPSKSDDDD